MASARDGSTKDRPNAPIIISPTIRPTISSDTGRDTPYSVDGKERIPVQWTETYPVDSPASDLIRRFRVRIPRGAPKIS